MRNLKFKRLLSYLIDYLIISLLIVLLSQIKSLNPNYEKYQESYKKYQEKYTEIVNSSNTSYKIDDELKEEMYNVSYYGMSYTIVEIIVIVSYFTFFPLLFGGQTIGKKITRIRIVHRNDEKDVGIFNYLIRALILPIFSTGLFYCAITLVGNLIGIAYFKQDMFININKVVLVIGLSWGYIDVIFSLSKNNNLALHDYIANTKVIEVDNN